MTRLGVLAFGDSITNGGGEIQWGVALQSWALWVARGLGLPFTTYAADGARARDVRGPDWDPAAFAADHTAILDVLAERCDRLLLVTLPLDLGRPRAGAKVADANAIIERRARETGTLVVDLARFRGRDVLMADHVHPTAFGQIAIAERALAVLAADGLPPRKHPREMISYETTRWGRLRGDATYAYRHAKVSGEAAANLLRLRLRR